VALLGAVGAVAALTRPDAGLIDTLPSLAGAVAGSAALLALVRAASAQAPLAWGPFSDAAPHSAPAGTPGAGFDRRRFLLTGALVAGGAVAAGTGGRVLARRSDVTASRAAVTIPAPASAAGPLAEGVAIELPGLSGFYTANRDFYRVDTALVVPRVAAEEWRLRVHGRVRRELELDFRQLLARPLLERDITLSCVSNEVGGGYVGTARWTGVSLAELLREAFERHLDACPACVEEVRELTETAARLGTAAAALPPPELWDRVRAEALVTRQLPPMIGRSDRRLRARRGGAVAGRRRFPPLLAAAAALLVAALSVTALHLGLLGRSDRSDRTAALVAAVLAAPDARRVAAMPGGAGQASVVVSRQRGRAVFVASGLPPAPAARTYQLWVVTGSGPRPAGLVDVAGGGRVTRLLDGPVTGDEQVAMTVERRGGAAEPTSEPVVVIDLEA
jgi:hypothetical protein